MVSFGTKLDLLYAYKDTPKTPGVVVGVGVAQLQPQIRYCPAYIKKIKNFFYKFLEICAFPGPSMSS